MSAPEAPKLQADASHDLEALLRSRIPLLIIETRDEPRVLKLLASLSVRLTRNAHTPVFQWTVTDGLRRLDVDLGGAQHTMPSRPRCSSRIRATDTAGIYVLLDFHPFLADPVHVRLLKDICLDYEHVPRTVVLISHEVALPRELEHLGARFRLAFPIARRAPGDHRERRAATGRRPITAARSRPIASRSTC